MQLVGRQVRFEVAENLLDHAGDAPVLVAERDAAHDGRAALGDGFAIGPAVGGVLVDQAGQRGDGAGAEADEGGGVVVGVALEVAVEAALQLGGGE